MPYRVEKKRDDFYEIIYFFKWLPGSTVVAIGSAKTLAEAERIRDQEADMENIASAKLDLVFTELRSWLKEKGLDKEIDVQTTLTWIEGWLYEKRMYLTDIN